MPQASHRIILIKFFDWIRGILTKEPKMDAEVIIIPLKKMTHGSLTGKNLR